MLYFWCKRLIADIKSDNFQINSMFVSNIWIRIRRSYVYFPSILQCEHNPRQWSMGGSVVARSVDGISVGSSLCHSNLRISQ